MRSLSRRPRDRRLLALVLALAAGASLAAGEQSPGPGGARCVDYVTLYDNQLPAHDFLSWAQGYIAASNLAYAQHIRVDGTALENWLVDYCRGHANHDYARAVLEFVRAHVD